MGRPYETATVYEVTSGVATRNQPNRRNESSQQWLPRQAGYQALTSREHAAVDAQHLPPGIQIRLFDLGRRHPELVGYDTVSVYDPLAAQSCEHAVRGVLALSTTERVTSREPAPHFPPLREVVIVQNLVHGGVDLLDRLPPFEMLQRVRVQQEMVRRVCHCRPRSQPVEMFGGERVLVGQLPAVGHPATREVAGHAVGGHCALTVVVHPQQQDL